MKFLFKIKYLLLHLTVLLISVECVIPVFAVADYHSTFRTTIQSSHERSKVGFYLLGDVEHEEQSKEDGKDTLLHELIDFSELINFLSKAHTQRFDFISSEGGYSAVQPPLFKLFCVFII